LGVIYGIYNNSYIAWVVLQLNLLYPVFTARHAKIMANKNITKTCTIMRFQVYSLNREYTTMIVLGIIFAVFIPLALVVDFKHLKVSDGPWTHRS